MNNSSDETTVFSPKFDHNGLIPAIVTNFDDGEVLMVAHMNEQALQMTLETGHAHFWSRSRNKLWRKGETSGEQLSVKAVFTDCDQDTIVLQVIIEGRGAACHTGRKTCFYREIVKSEKDGYKLDFRTMPKLFDPQKVYSDSNAL